MVFDGFGINTAIWGTFFSTGKKQIECLLLSLGIAQILATKTSKATLHKVGFPYIYICLCILYICLYMCNIYAWFRIGGYIFTQVLWDLFRNFFQQSGSVFILGIYSNIIFIKNHPNLKPLIIELNGSHFSV